MSQPVNDYSPIEDYAAIGNCHSLALVSRDGAIDWWCPERFDQPSVFAALLDPVRGGRFQIRPVLPYTARRQYIGRTNVLETSFFTTTGSIRLIDFMPVGMDTLRAGGLQPHGAIIRIVEGAEGEVEILASYAPRFDYGSVVPQMSDRGPMGFFCEHKADALALRSDVAMQPSSDGATLTGRATVRGGERRSYSLTFARGEPLLRPPGGAAASALVESTLRWWEAWASTCRYEGPFRDAVVRSALVLKLLAYAPSGAIVAAPTTSLPEEIGGVRNWDYRYCWLRDATMTIRALLDLGYEGEGRAFLNWLLHATRLTWPELQVLYDAFGNTRLPERSLDHLAGYRQSRPARVGNAASEQFQLDVYGAVVGAAASFVRRGHALSTEETRLLTALCRTVCRRWREPDEGLWEIRAGRRHHTHSKVMCWLALDNLLALAAGGHVRLSTSIFVRERDALRKAIESRGYNQTLNSYASVFDGDDVDASLLVLALQGYVDPGAPRMRSTYARVRERLAVNGLLRRYAPGENDGLPGVEGAFGICSFWSAHYRALIGELDGAAMEFEHLLSFANDVGLFAEEIDPDTGAALGNFPQAFTHIGLINAAVALAVRAGTMADEAPPLDTH